MFSFGPITVTKFTFTFGKLLNRGSDALGKSSGIRIGLKGQPEPFVAGAPVVKRRHDFVVLEVLFNSATKNHLKEACDD